jgi:flagellar hook-basal body complex protein FliE
MNPVIAAQGLAELAPASPAPVAGATPGGFSQVLDQVNSLLQQADQMAANYAQGKVGLTEAVLASSSADTAFGALMAVRNRALAAYQEIMNLQV